MWDTDPLSDSPLWLAPTQTRIFMVQVLSFLGHRDQMLVVHPLHSLAGSTSRLVPGLDSSSVACPLA